MRKLILLALLGGIIGCGDKRPKEQMEVDQAQHEPILICSKDGIRLYKVYDGTPGGTNHVYFTVPDGTTHWVTTDGEGNHTHHHVAGTEPQKKK